MFTVSDPSLALETTADILHLYANASTGDDGNDGKSPSAAKATVQAVFDAVPHVVDKLVIVHLSGQFSWQADGYYDGHAYLNGKHFATRGDVEAYAAILITGDDSFTVVDDNAGADYQSTGVTINTLTLTGAGWTEDEHLGKIVEITDGTQAGVPTGVVRNTSDTLYLVEDLPGLPGSPPKYRFVEPATSITSIPSTQPGDTFARNIGLNGCTGGHYFNCVFQGLTLVDLQFASKNSNVNTFMTGVMVRADASSTCNLVRMSYDDSATTFGSSSLALSPIDGIADYASEWARIGSCAPNGGAVFHNTDRATLFNGILGGDVSLRNCGVDGGTHICKSLTLANCRNPNTDRTDKFSVIRWGTIKGSSGAGLSISDSSVGFSSKDQSALLLYLRIENSTGSGVYIENSTVFFDDVHIEGSGGDAIKIDYGSNVHFAEPVTGSSNTGFALNVGDGCHVITEDVSTVTATAGEITFDGLNEVATFLDILSYIPALSPYGSSSVRSLARLQVREPSGQTSPVAEGTLKISQSGTPGTYGNGVSYIPLVKGAGDTIRVEFVASMTCTLAARYAYRTATAFDGTVEIRTDSLVLSDGDDPTAALSTVGTSLYAPGNNTNMHTAVGRSISVSRGDHVTVELERPTIGTETHTGDMHVLGFRIEAFIEEVP